MPTEVLRPNTWDNGWPEGFISNVDDPIEAPDGSTISTTVRNDTFRAGFTNVVNIRDGIDTVNGITIMIRTVAQYSTLGTRPEMFVTMYINGVSQGTPAPWLLNTSYVNFPFVYFGWNANWSVSQLNSIEIEVRVDPDPTTVFSRAWIDVIEVVVDYDIPPPITKDPDEANIILVGKSPTRSQQLYRSLGTDSIVVGGQVATLFREQVERPDTRSLTLNVQTPQAITTNRYFPATESLLIGYGSNVLKYSIGTALGSMSLSGKVPVSTDKRNVFKSPLRLGLRLSGQNIAADGEYESDRVRALLAGQDVTIDQELGSFPDTGTGFLALGTETPVANIGTITYPGEKVLDLTGYPLSSVLPVGAGTLTETGYVPGVFGPITQLRVEGYAPVLDYPFAMSAETLTLTGYVPLVENASVIVGEESLSITGKNSTLVFGSVLLAGDPGLISLTSNYSVEHIATPTEET